MFDVNLRIILPGAAMLLFLVALVISYRYRPTELKRSKLYNFIETLGPMSVLFICVNMFTEGLRMDKEEKDQRFEIYKESIENLYINFEKELLRHKRHNMIRPEFYASLHMNDPQLYELAQTIRTPINSKIFAAEQYICIRLIQVFESYLMYLNVKDISTPVWLALFLQWVQSQHVQEKFHLIKHHFNPHTVDFTYLLFEYANSIKTPVLDVEAYTSVSVKMHEDKRLKEIYEKVIDDGL